MWFKPYLKEYYNKYLTEGSFISYLAVEDDTVIGTSGVSINHKPPYYSCPTGKIGLISSMYTNPNYRRRGIAKTLLNKVVTLAKEKGCGIIHVTASIVGVSLYESYGFSHNNRFLQYKV